MRITFYIFLLLVIIADGCNRPKDISPEQFDYEVETGDSLALSEVKVEQLYGIDKEPYHIVTGRVRYSETLARLLYNTGLPGNKVQSLIEASEEYFDSRKIRAGNYYTGYYDKESNQPEYFVYEIDKLQYLRFCLKDSMFVERVSKETDTIMQFSAFSIKNSLWMTMIDKNLDPMLALELSEIYAWTIDFFGLQEGDSVRVVYDEVFVEGESAGINKIHAAYFKHAGYDYYAVLYNQNDKEGYYDLQGNSLEKTFLKAPLRFSRISSRYSHSRFHPILKIRRPHYGVDYAAPIGTPVHAIGEGIVTSVTYTKGAGRMVKIKHNGVYSSAYMHLRNFGKGIAKGARVTQGQVIGHVGSSGLSTGPHLDFRMYKFGKPVDPLKIESPPVEPVKVELIPDYNEKIYLALKELQIEQVYLAASAKKSKEKVF